MSNIFRCLLIIIGTIVGAGFASGQEMASFFNRFGNEGLIRSNIFWNIFWSNRIFNVICSREKENREI